MYGQRARTPAPVARMQALADSNNAVQLTTEMSKDLGCSPEWIAAQVDDRVFITKPRARCHDWRDYVPKLLESIWPSLTRVTRLSLIWVCAVQADQEEHI